MKRIILFSLVILFFTPGLVFPQELFTLTIDQPPVLILSISENIYTEQGVVIDLDTLYSVEGEISYVSEWKFFNGIETQVLDNPIVNITVEGIIYLSLIDENECTTMDSVAISFGNPTGEIPKQIDNLYRLEVYPNPNTGEFELVIPDCRPFYSIQVYNSLGIRIYSVHPDCQKGEHRELIVLPADMTGMYLLVVKRNRNIIYKQKIIVYRN